jgi:hypothetical protein
MPVQRFTDDRREKWLQLVESGATQEDANTKVGVSPVTIARWGKKGRLASEGPAFEFAQRLDALPARKPRPAPKSLVAEQRRGRLSLDDLVGLLEDAAIQGNVQAMKYLIERPWEKDADDEKPGTSIFDELAALRERKTGT